MAVEDRIPGEIIDAYLGANGGVIDLAWDTPGIAYIGVKLEQRHAAELGAELLPGVAAAEQRFREALAAVQAAAAVLDEEVFALDSTQGVLQAGERVFSPAGGDVGQLLSLVGRLQGAPLMRLPEFLLALGEQAGMVTTIEGGDYIPANLPHPRGARSMNELQAAQAARMAELAEG